MKKKIYNEKPVREEYHITERGKKLRPIIEQMSAFSLLYCSDEVFSDGKPRTFKEIVGRSPASF